MTLSNPAVRPARAVLVLAMLAALLAGCGGLTRPAVVKRTFLLDPPLPAAVTGEPKNTTLRVAPLNVAAPFRGKAFVYRTGPLAFERDYYDEFFVPPAAMLTDATARALAAARVFARVAPPGSSGSVGEYVLDGFVSALYADTRERARPAAVIAIDFYVSPATEPGTRVVWNRRYEQRATAQGDGPDALAQAWNAALGQLLADLARDLAAASLPEP